MLIVGAVVLAASLITTAIAILLAANSVIFVGVTCLLVANVYLISFLYLTNPFVQLKNTEQSKAEMKRHWRVQW